MDGSPNDVIEKDLMITYSPKPEQDYCIFDAVYAASVEEMTEKPITLDGGNFDPTTQEFLYESHVIYYCGLGRAFEVGSGDTEIEQDFICDWTGKWTPKPNLMDCICEYRQYVLRQCNFLKSRYLNSSFSKNI